MGYKTESSANHIPPARNFRYYDLIMAAFVTVIIATNMIGAEKVVTIFGLTFGGGILFFPISYFFNDILTEVYGYARSRKVVWAGFISLFFTMAMAQVILALPPAKGWMHQQAYEVVYGQTPRIVVASLVAFLFGEFANSFVLAKMKVLSNGKYLWTRTIGSTIAGEAVDSVIFYPLAFLGFWSGSLLVEVMIMNYLIKVTWEIIATPLTYRVVNFLKRAENEDYYDRDTNFTPFSLRL
ncbi:MAG: queuosine precursor transporter [Bacteroidetes bacterium]|nr:queuosine precursor transporter [Bacteroidota bacterium]